MDARDLVRARQTLDRLRPEDRRSFGTRAEEALLLALEGEREKASSFMDVEVLKYLDLNPFLTLIAAEFYAEMGEGPSALDWLERAVRQGDDRAEWFARDPALKSIWQDHRFQRIHSSAATRGTRSGEPR